MRRNYVIFRAMDSTAPAMKTVGERVSTHQAGNARQPVIGSILLGGSLTGALVRDVRLANELVQRGYEVHVWWAVDWQKTAGLDSRIKQHWLFHGFRFRSRRGSAVMEAIGRALSSIFADRRRSHWSQRRAKSVEKMMINLMHRVCDGVEGERQIIARFAREMESAGVSHMLPMLEFLCPWVAAARKQMGSPLRYVVTFQGYELYSTYARMVGRERELFDRLVETVSQSDWPAIAVSEDYLKRVVDDIGVPMSSMRAIPPGVPAAKRMNQAEAEQMGAQLSGMMAQMQEALKSMPPEQRAQMEAMMKGRGLPSPTAGAVKTTYKKGGTQRVGKWTCDVYEMQVNEQRTGELCTVSPQTLGLTPADIAVTRQLAEFMLTNLPQGAQALFKV